MRTVAVIDYGMGNLDSVRRALEECGARPVITSRAADLEAASALVLPGVGAFATGMERLRASGLGAVLRHQATQQGVPLLGICLGMQLLASRGSEHGPTQGLDLIEGTVARIEATHGERIPHVGWNTVTPRRPSPLFEGISEGEDFYFVHSYHFVVDRPDDILADTDYCGVITAAVEKGTICGVQFHPEKSQRPGLRLLKNFLAICDRC